MTTDAKTMRCAMCGKLKVRPDGFPMGHIYAECWECVWQRHVDQEHRPKRRWHLGTQAFLSTTFRDRGGRMTCHIATPQNGFQPHRNWSYPSSPESQGA